MTAETLWLFWTSKGWDVPLAIAAMLVGWMQDSGDAGDPLLQIDSAGQVNGRGHLATLYDKRSKYINDYAPLLIALWVLHYAPGASPGWYTRYPHVEAVVTDPACIEWARRIEP